MTSNRGLMAVLAGLALVCLVGGGVLVLTNQGDDDPQSVTPSDVGPREVTGPPRSGGTVTLALERPPTLDPADAERGIQAELIVADILFDGLTAFDPESGRPVEALAEKWASNDDLTIWSFQLRADATFHDGSPVTADDVKFTLERIARKGSSSAGSVQLELLEGYRELAIDRTADELTGIVVKDPRTVEIVLSDANASFPLLLASPLYGIVPRAAVESGVEPFAQRPVGSGPYAIERTDGGVVTLRKAGTEGFVENVVLQFHDDAAEAYEAFVNGEADFTRVPADRVAEAAGTFGDEHFEPYGAEQFYGLNLRQPKLSRPKLREAIVRAIDRQAIVDEVYAGTVAPLEAIVPTGVPGHRQGLCRCEHDPELARRLVEEIHPDGDVPTIFIDFDEGAPQDVIAEHIRNDLDAVGIPAVLRPKPFSSDSGVDYQTFVASGDQELFRLGWIGAYPSPEVYLGPLFASGSPDNVVGFSDPEVDAALAEARRTVDPDARRQKYAEAEQRVLAAHAIVPLVQFQTHAVRSARLQGLDVTVAGTFDITAVWVADGPAS